MAALPGLAEVDRRVNVDGWSVDLASGELWSLGTLARAIGETEHIDKTLERLSHGEWFTASLPPILAELGRLRNPAAHSAAVSVDVARRLRDNVLGVGV
jgi:hypothetical protein